MGQENPSLKKTPNALFISRSPIVHAYMREWRAGNISWEQMLLELAVALAESNERLTQMLIAHSQQDPRVTILDAIHPSPEPPKESSP